MDLPSNLHDKAPPAGWQESFVPAVRSCDSWRPLFFWKYNCSRWWVQPIWKKCSSNWIISPGIRVKITKILKAPPRQCVWWSHCGAFKGSGISVSTDFDRIQGLLMYLRFWWCHLQLTHWTSKGLLPERPVNAHYINKLRPTHYATHSKLPHTFCILWVCQNGGVINDQLRVPKIEHGDWKWLVLEKKLFFQILDYFLLDFGYPCQISVGSKTSFHHQLAYKTKLQWMWYLVTREEHGLPGIWHHGRYYQDTDVQPDNGNLRNQGSIRRFKIYKLKLFPRKLLLAYLEKKRAAKNSFF